VADPEGDKKDESLTGIQQLFAREKYRQTQDYLIYLLEMLQP